MSDSPLLTAALSYAARGWRIFPCKQGMKEPATRHGVKDATTDEGTIRRWWTENPNYNIALACGPGSGVYVVDVDLDKEKGKDGWKTLAGLSPMPMTVQQDTPRGGGHFIYQTTRPPRNKNEYMHAIDIRSDGYYIMLTPSIHPNGKPYRWVRDQGPGEIELAEFPDFMRPPEAAAAPATPPRPPKQRQEARDSTPIIERARLYLQEVDPAVQGQAGHDSLLWAARAMVVGFELDESTAISLLWSDFNPRCTPPWGDNETKDFERKAKEAARTPGTKPRGWLLDEYGLRQDNDEKVTEFANAVAERLLAGHAKKEAAKVAPAPAPEKHAPKELPTALKNRKKGNDANETYPDWLLYPQGMLGELSHLITDSAGCKQPSLSIHAAIFAFGALLGRKVCDESDGRTNVYIVGVAPSSAGKDHPGAYVEQLFADIGATQILGGSRVTSDAALELALQMYPVKAFVFDEVGHFFKSIKQAGVGSGGASHLVTIVPTFMQLYSSAHKLYIGKQKAEGEPCRIDQPHVCLWGLTSPEVLYSGFSPEQLNDGFLGRVITVISYDRPMYRPTLKIKTPKEMVRRMREMFLQETPAAEGVGDIASVTRCNPRMLTTTPAAWKVFDDFYVNTCYATMLKLSAMGDATNFLWGKGLQNARRLALILAASEDINATAIDERHALWACEMIRIDINRFADAIRKNVSGNVFEAEKLKLMRVIESGGAEGVAKYDLTRLTQFIRDSRTRDSYIQDMAEAKLIDVVTTPTGKKGPPKTRYFKHPFGLQINTTQEDDK